MVSNCVNMLQPTHQLFYILSLINCCIYLFCEALILTSNRTWIMDQSNQQVNQKAKADAPKVTTIGNNFSQDKKGVPMGEEFWGDIHVPMK